MRGLSAFQPALFLTTWSLLKLGERLLCIRAAEEAGKDCSLSTAFRCFLQLCERGVVQIADSLGKQLEVPRDDRDHIRSFAREALADLGV